MTVIRNPVKIVDKEEKELRNNKRSSWLKFNGVMIRKIVLGKRRRKLEGIIRTL